MIYMWSVECADGNVIDSIAKGSAQHGKAHGTGDWGWLEDVDLGGQSFSGS